MVFYQTEYGVHSVANCKLWISYNDFINDMEDSDIVYIYLKGAISTTLCTNNSTLRLGKTPIIPSTMGIAALRIFITTTSHFSLIITHSD